MYESVHISVLSCAGVEHLMVVPACTPAARDQVPCNTCHKLPSYLLDPASLAVVPRQSRVNMGSPHGLSGLLLSCKDVPYFISSPVTSPTKNIKSILQSYNAEQDQWLIYEQKGLPETHYSLPFFGLVGMDDRSCLVGFAQTVPWMCDIRTHTWCSVSRDAPINRQRVYVSAAALNPHEVFVIDRGGGKHRIFDLRNMQLRQVELSKEIKQLWDREGDLDVPPTVLNGKVLIGMGGAAVLYDPVAATWQVLEGRLFGPDQACNPQVVSLPRLE